MMNKQNVSVRTVRGVAEHQALQVAPLRVEPLHQFEGVDGMAQETLGVLGGGGRQGFQFVGPPVAHTAS